MTDKAKNCTSNEEIIEEITKKVEGINPADAPQSPDTAEDIFPPEHEGSDSEDVKESKLFDDYIDEEKLKEEEAELSEEDKERRKSESDALKQKGNDEFKSSNYLESINIYTSALRICPLSFTNERSVLYSNRAASKIRLGSKESALDDCTKAIELNPDYVKALLRRAKLYEDMDKLDESLEDYKKLQVLNPSDSEIHRSVFVLGQKIEKRNEEMKTEMLGKLKDLGNLILKPFGMSTDNFQLNKDPNSEGYSVNFVQKK